MGHTEGEGAQRVGKYEILGLLGEGAMGIVYRARDPEIGRIVAIKTLRRDALEACSDLPTLQNEARSAGRLRHPNIVTIYDIFTLQNLPHIVMEFVEGEPLDSVIERSNRLSPVQAVDILAKLADALDYAHSEGILHCDIKPSNVLISATGDPLILDFGIASALGAGRKEGGSVMGTPSYMSPEQILGQILDGRSDVFSLAIVAFECFSGETPFAGEDYQRTLSNILTGNRFSLGTFEPSLPLALDAEFEKALSVDPGDRYATAREMIAGFAVALGLPSPYRQVPLSGGKTSSEALAALRGAGKAPSVASFSSERLSSPLESGMSGNDLIGLEGIQRPRTSRSEKLFSDVQSVKRAKSLKKISLGLGILALTLGGYIVLELSRSNNVPLQPRITTPIEADVTVEVGGSDSDTSKRLSIANDQEVIELILDPGTPESTRVAALREVAARPIHSFAVEAEKLFHQSGYRMRIEIVRALGALQDPVSLDALGQALADRDPAVRKEAAVMLGEFPHPHAEQILRKRIIREREQVVIEAIRYALTQLRKNHH